MKCLFKISFFLLLGTIWPGSVSAETLRATTNQDLTTFEKFSNPHLPTERVTAKLKKKVIEKYRHFFSKGQKAGQGGKIVAIIFLVLGGLVFGLFGLTWLLVAILNPYFVGDAIVSTVIISIISLMLSTLCIMGIIRIARKLHRLKHPETIPEELPRRPPSRNLKHQ